MNLNQYFSLPDAPTMVGLAKELGTSAGMLQQWRYGRRRPKAENCLAIEKITHGKVTRQALRPEDFHEIWPDLAHLALAADKVEA